MRWVSELRRWTTAEWDVMRWLRRKDDCDFSWSLIYTCLAILEALGPRAVWSVWSRIADVFSLRSYRVSSCSCSWCCGDRDARHVSGPLSRENRRMCTALKYPCSTSVGKQSSIESSPNASQKSAKSSQRIQGIVQRQRLERKDLQRFLFNLIDDTMPGYSLAASLESIHFIQLRFKLWYSHRGV